MSPILLVSFEDFLGKSYLSPSFSGYMYLSLLGLDHLSEVICFVLLAALCHLLDWQEMIQDPSYHVGRRVAILRFDIKIDSVRFCVNSY